MIGSELLPCKMHEGYQAVLFYSYLQLWNGTGVDRPRRARLVYGFCMPAVVRVAQGLNTSDPLEVSKLSPDIDSYMATAEICEVSRSHSLAPVTEGINESSARRNPLRRNHRGLPWFGILVEVKVSFGSRVFLHTSLFYIILYRPVDLQFTICERCREKFSFYLSTASYSRIFPPQ